MLKNTINHVIRRNTLCIETSAPLDANIEECFSLITNDILKNINTR